MPGKSGWVKAFILSILLAVSIALYPVFILKQPWWQFWGWMTSAGILTLWLGFDFIAGRWVGVLAAGCNLGVMRNANRVAANKPAPNDSRRIPRAIGLSSNILEIQLIIFASGLSGHLCDLAYIGEIIFGGRHLANG